MQPQRLSAPPSRRSPVFRLRSLPLRPPVGQAAYQAHGDASLPELEVRSSDVLCVSPGSAGGAIQVLEPQTPGHPMLGHRPNGKLRSLPANLPCSDSLWAPVGSVVAIWRRGLSSQPGPAPLGIAGHGGSIPTRRAVCVRIPQAALALVRAEHPELMGAQLQAAPQPGGTVLVFPGSAASARPVAQASAHDLQNLADQLALALGPGAVIQSVSAAEVSVTIQRELDLAGASVMARSIARRVRLPLAVAVADTDTQALQLAGSLGGDQLLFLLPPAASKPVASPAAFRLGSAPVLQASAPRPPALVSSAPAAWAGAASSSPRRPAQPGAVQLSLFDRAEAA